MCALHRNYLAVNSYSQGAHTWAEWLDMPEWLREDAEDWAREQSKASGSGGSD